MDSFNLITAGLPIMCEPYAIFMCTIGTLIGILVGGIPGLGAAMAVSIFLPMTFHLPDTIAIIFLMGICVGSCYAGSITAITLNIPGTASAVATALDGYKMAQKGLAGEAIGYATLSSAVGGILGVFILMIAAPPLANAALEFSAQEYTGIALMGVTIIGYISFGSTIKGLIGGTIGFLLASIGQEVISGFPRLSFGSRDLQGGLNMIAVLIGLFGLTEILSNLERQKKITLVANKIGRSIPNLGKFFRMFPMISLSSAFGVFIGAVPAAGGAIASLGAYGIQKRISKKSDKFGTGIPEGVVAAESANNAAIGGSLVPTLCLGIPGDPQTAVLIGALMLHGLIPGPQLFVQRPDLISSIYLSNILAIFVFVIFGVLAAGLCARLARTPSHYLMPAILIFSIIGTFAIRYSLFDVWTFLVIGFMGYLLKKIGIMPAPIVLGFILGPIFEDNFRRALIMSDGDWTTFLTRPLSLALILINLLILFGPMIMERIRR
jgi:putative tricarboxylic transport membrane protein